MNTLKSFLIVIAMMLSCAVLAQNNNYRDWYSFGIMNMSKGMSSISDNYDGDSYNITNYPTAKFQMVANDRWIQGDLSGFFQWVISLKSSDSDDAGFNLQSRTRNSAQLIQDRISLEWITTKLRNADQSSYFGIGKQFGLRRFGFTDNPLLKAGLTLHPDYPNPGPYSYRGALTGGVNFQYFMHFGKNISTRAGLFINGALGFGRYGAIAYPEVSAIVNVGRLGIIGTAAYEVYYFYTPTGSAFKNEPVKNTAMVNGLRTEIAIALDISKRK